MFFRENGLLGRKYRFLKIALDLSGLAEQATAPGGCQVQGMLEWCFHEWFDRGVLLVRFDALLNLKTREYANDDCNVDRIGYRY